jgi:hypothetical protein
VVEDGEGGKVEELEEEEQETVRRGHVKKEAQGNKGVLNAK